MSSQEGWGGSLSGISYGGLWHILQMYAKELEVTYLWNKLNEENTELNTSRRNFHTEVSDEDDIEKKRVFFFLVIK